MKKLIQIIIILLFFSNMYSQVTFTITDVKVNNVAVPSGGSIQFGNNSSVVVRFKVTFTKPNALLIGNVSYEINSTSNNGLIEHKQIEYFNLGLNNTGFQNLYEKTLYAADYSYNGGDYLFALVKQMTGNPPLRYETNRVPILRTPVFTPNPSGTTLVVCGDTAPKYFAVTNSGLPAGSNVTYNWSFGQGWYSPSSYSTSNVSVFPGAVGPLENITVQVVFNGVTLPVIVFQSNRPFFTSAAVIAGPTGICTGSAFYSISTIGSGQTVSWSLSNPSLGTLSNADANGATVNFNGAGAQILTARIQNQCGEIVNKTFVINTNNPNFRSGASLWGNFEQICVGQAFGYYLENLGPNQTVVWTSSNPQVAILTVQLPTLASLNYVGPGITLLTATITNSCGLTDSVMALINVGGPLSGLYTLSNQTLNLCMNTGMYSYTSSLGVFNRITANFQNMSPSQINTNGNWEWETYNNLITLNGTENIRAICYNGEGSSGIRFRAKNGCDWSDWVEIPIEIEQTLIQNFRMSQPQKNYTVFPNPSNDLISIALKDNRQKSENKNEISAELFDLMGVSKLKVQVNENKAVFSVKNLNKGIYLLKIITDEKVENHQIVVQ